MASRKKRLILISFAGDDVRCNTVMGRNAGRVLISTDAQYFASHLSLDKASGAPTNIPRRPFDSLGLFQLGRSESAPIFVPKCHFFAISVQLK